MDLSNIQPSDLSSLSSNLNDFEFCSKLLQAIKELKQNHHDWSIYHQKQGDSKSGTYHYEKIKSLVNLERALIRHIGTIE